MKLNLPAAMNNVEKDSSQAENEADSGSASEDMVSCQSFVLVNRCMAFCQFKGDNMPVSILAATRKKIGIVEMNSL
jgi:hypothetical protein